MYLLKINRKGDIYKDEDGAMGVPEFVTLLKAEKLGPTALRWVALIYDYDSPYRHFTEKDRIRCVSQDIYKTHDWKDRDRMEVKLAVIKYKELQYDPLDEQLAAFNGKIDQFTSFMNDMEVDEDSAESLQKIMIGIEKILKTRQSLLDAIERRGERKKIVGDKGMSLLEQRLDIKNN